MGRDGRTEQPKGPPPPQGGPQRRGGRAARPPARWPRARRAQAAGTRTRPRRSGGPRGAAAAGATGGTPRDSQGQGRAAARRERAAAGAAEGEARTGEPRAAARARAPQAAAGGGAAGGDREPGRVWGPHTAVVWRERSGRQTCGAGWRAGGPPGPGTASLRVRSRYHAGAAATMLAADRLGGPRPGGVLRHPPRGALCFVPEKKCRKKLLILADMSNRMRKHAGKIAKKGLLVVLPPPLENRRSMAKKG